MVAFEFNPQYLSFLIFILAAVPGLAVGWPLFKKSQLSKTEKFLLSLFLGLIISPSLMLVEGLAGIKFSLTLVYINFVLITAAGIAWGVKTGAFSLKPPEIDFNSILEKPYEFAKANGPGLVLIIIVLLSFWLRIQTFSPIYSELDPYFYVYGSGQIIREGIVPPTDDTGWWPEIMTSHRSTAIKTYLEAQWFAAYTGGAEYNNYLLFAIASWLPPISAAFMAFGAYLLIASIYGRRYGILAAFLMAFSPISIFKMSAGVNEAAPVGMMMLFVSVGSLAYALVNKDKRVALFSGAAFFATVTGSNYISVLALPFAGFLVLQSLDYFVREKDNKQFLEISAYAFSGAIIGSILNGIYNGALIGVMTSGAVVIMAAGAAFAGAMHYSSGLGFNRNKRTALIGAGAFVLLALLLFTPVGDIAKSQITGYIGSAEFNFPLDRTIAEQNEAGTSFEGEGGFLAMVPKNRILQDPEGLEVAANIIYSALDIISVPFTIIGNALLQAIDVFFNLLVGTSLSTSNKQDSLLFVFLVISIMGLALRHFSRKGEAREIPSIMVIVLLLIVPVLYVGVNKIKFTIFAGVMVVVAAAAALGELERFFAWLAAKMKKEEFKAYVKGSFVVLIVLVAYAQATIPSAYPIFILSKSFEPRYQDDPAAMMPKLADLCEGLQQVNYYDPEICSAGYDETFADTIDQQFNQKVCWVSQMTFDELVPGESEAQQRKAAEARAGAQYRCNRLADYWVDSMEWIKNNVGDADRVTSWWDYGHWINYFGDRKTVLRNEHASRGMIGRIAYSYIIGTPQDLIDSMNYFDSRYVLFDLELIGSGSFGGKYGALNYLGCAHDYQTSVKQGPGTSDCEFEHSPERVVIPKVQAASTACTISQTQQRTGVVAYPITKTGLDQQNPVYCVGELMLGNGETISATYYIDRKDENNDLVLSKGFLRQTEDQGSVGVYELVYNDLLVWPQNGTLVGGMEDAKTGFYTSNLYAGAYLEKIPGFELVYKSKNGDVKIYKLLNFTGNKQGHVDPDSIGRTQ